MGKLKRLVGAALALVAVFAFGLGQTSAQEVPQGYGSDQNLQVGMIVRLKSGDASKVEALKQTEISAMHGVVVSASSSPVSLTNGQGGTQVYVATTGRYEVLVSTQNGAIKEGDFITASALDGVGMKAGDSQELVLGKALQGFDGSNAQGTATLKDAGGGQTTVSLARIPVTIGVARNPGLKVASSSLPGFLQRTAQSIAQKPVSDMRIYIGLAVLVVAAVISGSLLYAGVRSGITAVGRNPLAKRSITRSIIQVSLVALIIFIIGVFAIYLILKL